jgi:hypothetical protein
MTVEMIQAFFNWLNQMANLYHLGYFGVVIIAIYTAYLAYKDAINWLVLRVEKDSADGEYTNKEKEDTAVDFYFTQLLPKLPPYMGFLKIMPRFFVEPLIRKIIKGICKNASKMKKPDVIKDAV